MKLELIFRTEEDILRFRDENVIPDYFDEDVRQAIQAHEWSKWMTYIPYRKRGEAKRNQRYPMTLEQRA